MFRLAVFPELHFADGARHNSAWVADDGLSSAYGVNATATNTRAKNRFHPTRNVTRAGEDRDQCERPQKIPQSEYHDMFLGGLTTAEANPSQCSARPIQFTMIATSRICATRAWPSSPRPEDRDTLVSGGMAAMLETQQKQIRIGAARPLLDPPEPFFAEICPPPRPPASGNGSPAAVRNATTMTNRRKKKSANVTR